MDFDRLAEFASIATHKSIKKAARELGLSAATLSARLIRFEQQIGTPLFERRADSMVLTAAGEQLLPSGLELLSEYKKVCREIKTAQTHAYRQLRIAVCGAELPLYLGPFLDHLNLNNPGIHITLLNDSVCGIQEGLLSGMVDIYFAPVTRDFAPQGLVKTQIATPNQHVILPRKHPLANRTMVSLRDLEGETFILYPKTAAPVVREFQLSNLERSGISYQVYDSDTSALFYSLLVPIGKGVIIIPTHQMGLPPNSVRLPLTDIPLPASICYFYSKNNTNPDVAAFVRDFAAFAKELSTHEYRQNL